MGLKIFLLGAAILLWFGQANSYKIFVYSPTLAHSHVSFLGKIADSLLDAGHEVLMYVPILDPDVHTSGTNRAPVLRVDVLDDPSMLANHPMKDPFENFELLDDNSMDMFIKIYSNACKGQISNKRLMQKLREQHFDIAISEFHDYCPFAIFKLLGIPANIVASSMPMTQTIGDLFGVPEPLSYVPSMFGSFSDEMSYKERAINSLISRIYRNCVKKVLDIETKIIHQYHGRDFPPLEHLAKKTAMAFINADELIAFPRPINHRIVYIGGIGASKPKALSKDVASIVEASDKGIIALSFGSIANSTLLSMEKKLAILRTMANFPEYTFIWKYERPEEDWELFTNYSNVYPMKWLPQVDLLNHPNVKVFITHGGLNSISEAIYSGTPTVAIPLFADQEHNVASAVKRGVSVSVNKRNLNTESLTAALQEILLNEKYATNAKRLAQMIEKKPLKPKELVVKWTEFVAEFKDLSNLDIAGRDFSFVKYFLLDIIAPIVLLAITVLYAAFKVGLFLARNIHFAASLKEKQL